jgi:hypothetical protein
VTLRVHEVDALAGLVLGFQVHGRTEAGRSFARSLDVIDDEAEVIDAGLHVVVIDLAIRRRLEQRDVDAIVSDVGAEPLSILGLTANA